jgi:hypothetical protein
MESTYLFTDNPLILFTTYRDSIPEDILLFRALRVPIYMMERDFESDNSYSSW